ncbi:uncharacterized protein Tco025E_03083 [Trypanosoma conorhini]|uniref:Uncharacterized protein n=1 Tax=Trypanosoma conorhini TaxID=83891 RepID=A0A422PXL6_9TRYP|nr:uncharacterized protein Tco025E_03083 [Trypanosoma conorhini]RNF22483.1 hypothetical protein Tco025E_03083 [Trypanosoma conorhini]
MPPKKAAEGPPKKKKEPPKELCGCGVDTYRPPPKGKKKVVPIEHAAGCVYQRTTCNAYPHLQKCPVCLKPCKYCAGTNRWCPYCYENRCINIYKRIVHGHAREEPQRKAVVSFVPADGNGAAPAVLPRSTRGSFTR